MLKYKKLFVHLLLLCICCGELRAQTSDSTAKPIVLGPACFDFIYQNHSDPEKDVEAYKAKRRFGNNFVVEYESTDYGLILKISKKMNLEHQAAHQQDTYPRYGQPLEDTAPYAGNLVRGYQNRLKALRIVEEKAVITHIELQEPSWFLGSPMLLLEYRLPLPPEKTEK